MRSNRAGRATGDGCISDRTSRDGTRCGESGLTEVIRSETLHGGTTATESADRRYLYYAKQSSSPSSIWRVPIEGGTEERVADGLSYSLNFVVADRGLYFLAVGNAPGKASIDFFEFATGARTRIVDVAKPWWYGMALSPDGKLLFSLVNSAGSNLMVVENFR